MADDMISWPNERIQRQMVCGNGTGRDQDVLCRKRRTDFAGIQAAEVVTELRRATDLAITLDLGRVEELANGGGFVFREGEQLVDRDAGTACLG
jgi:hypothetical protein